MSSSMKTKECRLPAKTVMSFWRSRLNRLFRQDVLLRRIVIDGKRLSFETQSWEEYWRGAFPQTPAIIRQLHEKWCAHLSNCFCKASGKSFGAVYMDAVREAINNKWSGDAKRRLLSLENIVVCRKNSTQPLAAMSTNFRNPIILLRQSDSDISSHYNETLLLPLMAAGNGDETHVFFHYRRQNLLRNTNDALLFFPRVDLSIRGDSFCILQELVEVLVNEWDSRIEQRANLLAEKVILPLLPGLKQRSTPIRTLDVGFGAGLFTSRLIKRTCQGSDTKRFLFDLTLMDQLVVDPGRYFREHSLSKILST